MKKKEKKSVLSARYFFGMLVFFGVPSFYAFYISNFNPNRIGLVVGLLIAVLVVTYMLYDIYWGEDRLVSSKGIRHRSKIFVGYILLLNFGFFSIFGVYGIANIYNYFFGKYVINQESVILAGNTRRKRVACENTIYVISGFGDYRKRYCLSLEDYQKLRRDAEKGLGKVVAEMVYKRSNLGYQLVGVK